MAISTVYACVRIISQTLAMLPLVVYRRRADGGKERATNHPLYDVIHARPNVRQSSFQFREMLMGHALLRGNAYAQRLPGPRGFVDQLVPLHPDRVTPKLASDGTIHYEVRLNTGTIKTLLQDEVFHISTLSDDSIQGLSLVGLARESFGLAESTQKYGKQFFTNGARPGGILKMPGKLGVDAHARLKADWANQYGGDNNHKPAILEEGMEWTAMGLSNEDSQFLETRAFQVEEIASWFGVPLSLLQHTEKSTSWGTGIGQLTQGFTTFTMQPWFTRWEQEISSALIGDNQTYFAEFVVEGLLRGDHATRAQFYGAMVDRGIFTRNEVRRIENMNPLPGLDDPLTPLNTSRGGNPDLTRALAGDAAERMTKKEANAISRAATKHATDLSAFKASIVEFYSGYESDLMSICHLDANTARIYAAQQRDEVLCVGVGAAYKDSGKLLDLMLGTE